MARLPFKKRSHQPIQPLEMNFEGSLKNLGADFLKSQPFRHALIKGQQREKTVGDFFRERLPSRFSVSSGQVVDLDEHWSPQLDVMVFDSSRNFPIVSNGNSLLPAEALLVAIEVKTTLTRDELRSSYIAANTVKSLRPFRREVAYDRKGGEDPEDDRTRYFCTVFAYSSDLSDEDWSARENMRCREVSREENVPVESLDRVYVAHHGLIMPSQSRVLPEADGVALMNFFMHTYIFLERENSRRPSVPYLDYAGRMTAGWQEFPG